MIKQTLVEIRDIADRELKQHSPNVTPNTPSGNIMKILSYNCYIVDQRSQMRMSRKERNSKLKQDNDKNATKEKSNKKLKLAKRGSQISNDENLGKKKKKSKMVLVDEDSKS